MHNVASSKNSQIRHPHIVRLNEPDNRDIGNAGRLPEDPSDRMIDWIDYGPSLPLRERQ
jgi:hypothetical protein